MAEETKPFTSILQQLDDGNVHADMSALLKRGLGSAYKLAQESGVAYKGELTLKVTYTVDPRGVVTISAPLSSKEPLPKRNATTVFMQKDGNVGAENPRQPGLPGTLKRVGENKPD